MRGKPKKSAREKDFTSRYLSGGMDADADAVGNRQQFNRRSKFHQQNKTARTAKDRQDLLTEEQIATLPRGLVLQVYSRYLEVRDEAGASRLCVVRKTLQKTGQTQIVVGDRVRFRPPEGGSTDVDGVIEHVEPRQTVLTRADSFKAIEQHPIVANAEQMLIVASVWAPFARWGLVDRMLIAARAGGLEPVIVLNKIDLADSDDDAKQQMAIADEALAHYETLGVGTIRASVERSIGIDALRETLRGRITVLAGHSGVGKSSLTRAVQPSLELKVGEVSSVHLKGKHTTTSARYYDLEIGGAVIDTPGVKLFGLWGVTLENLDEFYPDIAAGAAPVWRVQSHERIAESLAVQARR